MEKISFAEFKRRTHHKKVKFNFFSKNGNVKEFSSEKFYCNKDSRIREKVKDMLQGLKPVWINNPELV